MRTFGFELRTLDVRGTPAAAVMRAAWPAVALALAAGLGCALVPVGPRPEGDPGARRTHAPLAWALVALLTPIRIWDDFTLDGIDWEDDEW